MSKKLGNLIKSARNDAGFTQEALAKKIKVMSASEISRAERGESEPTSDQLKAIAKACGVTQKSLLDAAKGSKGTKTSTSSSSSYKLTANEKKLVDLYRKADSKTKTAAMNVLKGESNILETIMLSMKDKEGLGGLGSLTDLFK